LKLKNLTHPNLSRTRVGDAGVKALAAVPLQELYVSGTGVTDTGLKALRAVPTLEYLNVEGCAGVTETGVEDVKKALPRCRVVR
jgi:hypothetical protein